MNLFIKKLILYSILSFGVLFLINYLLLLRVNNNITADHDNLEQTINVNADVVFIGSSRCWVHFNPSFFNEKFNLKTINIGVDGHTELSMAYSRLVDYLKGNDNPKYAVLSFDPFIRAGSFEGTSENIVHKNSFSRYAFRPINKDWQTIKQFNFNTLEKYFPLYAIFKYDQLANCLFPNNNSSFTKYGYDRHDESWNTNIFQLVSNLKSKFFDTSEISAIKEALTKIDKLCCNNRIKLICIQTPVFENIYDKEAFRITKNICDTLNISFIDANIRSIRTDTSSFYNANHMNTSGVNKMNDYLSQISNLFCE
ncbi:MAG: hypothetical protein JW717_01360 [Marinilabiliaceae bacterium]|nr:hypothetical protein [Marinilabiliaceae bacterium]